jgi:hypothetical protein
MRSSAQVTTGSAASRIRASIAGGTWNRERTTSPTVNSRSAAMTGRVNVPTKKRGFGDGPPDVARRSRGPASPAAVGPTIADGTG